ncbi:hypothetical protein C4J81_17990 [Deltaproteobacteria bacterium Smac51]|nr:hypothetical protein C4J81_17990 [Deltaproteobacteria bacterium Smac51]
MPRPKHDRHVATAPTVTYFKPQGVPMIYLEEVKLSVEGLEAIRLADLEGLTATEAAERMKISRHTFGRILAEGRAVVAQALVAGLALRIEGGNWVFADSPPPCHRPRQAAGGHLGAARGEQENVNANTAPSRADENQ